MRRKLVGPEDRSLGRLPARFMVTLAFFVGVFATAASASTATTIGQTSASANYFCDSEIDVQSDVASGASFVVPTGSWLVDSWSTFGGGAGGSMSMMIFRPATGPFPYTYTVVAETPVQTLTPGELNTFSTSIVVHGGDLLGFWSGSGAACATNTGLPADFNPYLYGSEPAVGATVTLATAPGYLLNISA